MRFCVPAVNVTFGNHGLLRERERERGAQALLRERKRGAHGRLGLQLAIGIDGDRIKVRLSSTEADLVRLRNTSLLSLGSTSLFSPPGPMSGRVLSGWAGGAWACARISRLGVGLGGATYGVRGRVRGSDLWC